MIRLLPLLALLGGCNGLLGLDEAHLDPTIGAAGASAEGAGGDTTAPPKPSCDEYCREITENCTEEHAQYTDLDACLSVCPKFREGEPSDTDGNSLGCRLHYALKAPSEPITYCTWAGPGGDGACGSNCEGFCTLMAATCTAESTSGVDDHFASEDACLSSCATVPQRAAYSVTAAASSGANTFECRLYHVAAALYSQDAAVHCPHAMGHRLCVDQ